MSVAVFAILALNGIARLVSGLWNWLASAVVVVLLMVVLRRLAYRRRG